MISFIIGFSSIFIATMFMLVVKGNWFIREMSTDGLSAWHKKNDRFILFCSCFLFLLGVIEFYIGIRSLF